MRHVLGEGAFGCVIKPSLKCNDMPGIPYDHYISKLMKSNAAKQELSDFIIISQLDKKKKYHLGTPTICVPDIKEADVIQDIEKCKRFNGQDVLLHPEDYRILILKDGGYDLSIFCKLHLKQFVLGHNSSQLFWLHIHHLFKGLVFFKNNDIVHYDLKPQNIVFDPQTMKFQFIDFGLMNRTSTIIETSKKSENKHAVFHWSYPIDNGFLNHAYFNDYKKLSRDKKREFENKFIHEIFPDKSYNNAEIIKNPYSFHILFSYIYLKKDWTDDAKNDLQLFFSSFDDYTATHSYANRVEKTVNSLDIYGLGFSLKYVLNEFYKLNAISKPFYKKVDSLLKTMYSFDLELREDSPEKLLYRYEQILQEFGLLSFFNKKIDHHHIINESMDITHNSNSNRNTSHLDEFAYEDAIQIQDDCSEKGKVFNPITKRCVKKCAVGKRRNSQFKCVSKKNKHKVKKYKNGRKSKKRLRKEETISIL